MLSPAGRIACDLHVCISVAIITERTSRIERSLSYGGRLKSRDVSRPMGLMSAREKGGAR